MEFKKTQPTEIRFSVLGGLSYARYAFAVGLGVSVPYGSKDSLITPASTGLERKAVGICNPADGFAVCRAAPGVHPAKVQPSAEAVRPPAEIWACCVPPEFDSDQCRGGLKLLSCNPTVVVTTVRSPCVMSLT